MDMNLEAYEFTQEQRYVVDRYMRFLDGMLPIYDKIPLVFERREKSGHRRAGLDYDSRFNQASFTQRMLRDYGRRTESARLLCSDLVQKLLAFKRDALDITSQTSTSKRLDQVDCGLFSFSRDPVWSSPPTQVIQMVHALGGQCWSLKGAIEHMKDPIPTIYQNSFGLKAAFFQALDYRSCECHPQSIVVEELFREAATTPVWDIAYSSTDPQVRAGEYKSDITLLFNKLTTLYTQMGAFIEGVFQRVERVEKELFQTADVTTLGRLNAKLELVVGMSEDFAAMINQFDAWVGE